MEDSVQSEFERTMEEVDRLIAESEALLETVDRNVGQSSNETRGMCTIDCTDTDEDITPGRSPADEAILAAATANARTAASLMNDSEIEILDCTTFPMPLITNANNDDDEDDVCFVSERIPTRHRTPPRATSAHFFDLVSPPSHINITADFGNRPTNINVNIGFAPSAGGIVNRVSSRANTSMNATAGKKRKPTHKEESAKKPSPEPAEPEAPGNGFTCAVCLEQLKGHLKPVSTNCGHLFCLACLQGAIRVTGKCPLCNKKQGKNSFHRIYI